MIILDRISQKYLNFILLVLLGRFHTEPADSLHYWCSG